MLFTPCMSYQVTAHMLIQNYALKCIVLDQLADNINFQENPSSGAGFFRAGGRMDRQTEETKSIVAFRNFANAPKK